ncbi:MAG TPA: hypothetical protein VGC27_06095, partial [Rhizomicrobium sp.]
GERDSISGAKLGAFSARPHAGATNRFAGKTLVDGIIHLPLVLPPVAFGIRGPLGGWSRALPPSPSSRA